MKFLILNTDYPEFLDWFYTQHPELEEKPYEWQMRARYETFFGMADFYSSNFRKLGHEAWDIYANNERMQRKWAIEHGTGIEVGKPIEQGGEGILRYGRWLATKTPMRLLNLILQRVLPRLKKPPWFYEILSAQIKHYKPDVLFNQEMDGISLQFLREIKPYVRLLVGQHAATRLSVAGNFSCYDLVTSSFPPTLEYFRQRGVRVELNRLAFEPKVLSCLKGSEKVYDVTFIGSFYSVHRSRVAFLEALCTQFPQMRIWGPAVGHLSNHLRIQRCYVGPAWGREMYRILRCSRITLNHHGDVAPYANNMRLFEATGVGTLLITDLKNNLKDMFELNKEVVAYRTSEECTELIRYYLEREDERESIARAGQERTLREHTYYQRVQELVEIIKQCIG